MLKKNKLGCWMDSILQVLRVLKNLKFDSNLLPISRCFKGEKVTETLRKVQIQLGVYKTHLIKHTGLNFKGTKWVKYFNRILNLEIPYPLCTFKVQTGVFNQMCFINTQLNLNFSQKLFFGTKNDKKMIKK